MPSFGHGTAITTMNSEAAGTCTRLPQTAAVNNQSWMEEGLRGLHTSCCELWDAGGGGGGGS